MAEGRAHGNIAGCYELLGKFGKSIEHHTRVSVTRQEGALLTARQIIHFHLKINQHPHINESEQNT